MSVNSNFYIKGSRPTILEILDAFKKEGIELEVLVSYSAKHTDDTGKTIDYNYYRLYNTIKDLLVWYFPYNYTSGGDRDGLDEATLNSSVDDFAVDTLRKVGKYFGGTLEPSDGANSELIYIPKKNSINSPPAFDDFIFSNYDYKTALIISKFMNENKEKILEYIKGDLKCR